MKLIRLLFQNFNLCCLAFLALCFSALPSYGANVISLDPDGTGSRGETVVLSFDWAPGSVLIGPQAGGPSSVIPLTPATTTTAQTYAHGALVGVHDGDGDAANLDGLNTDYQITFTVSNGVVITPNSDASEVLFDLDPLGNNFFQIIYDDVVNASSLSGEGYSDGLVILSGQLVALSGNFTVPDDSLEVLDQSSNGDDWAGTQTIVGEGAQQIFVLVDYVDKDFFTSGLDKGSILPFNNSEVLAFLQTNPSDAFDETAASQLPTLVADVGAINGVIGPHMLLQIDPNNAFTFIPPEQACRVTGGGNDTAGLTEGVAGWDGTVAEAAAAGSLVEVPVGKSGKTKLQEGSGYEWTMGGQAGANTAKQPQPKGEWEHNNHVGPEGLQFAFHGGTSSGGPGTEIDEIICTDDGWCKQARPAPSKQIDFVGIGEFSNFEIDDTSYAGDGVYTFPGIGDVVVGSGGCKPGNGPKSCNQNPGPETGTYHWFQVHIEDLGEPGNKADDGAVCPEEGSGNNPFAEPPVVDNIADCGCADFYRITIYQGFDPMLVDGEVTGSINKTDKIYEVWGYLDGGNFQIHPLTGFDLK